MNRIRRFAPQGCAERNKRKKKWTVLERAEKKPGTAAESGQEVRHSEKVVRAGSGERTGRSSLARHRARFASPAGSVKYSGDGYQLLGVDLSDLALLEGALRGAGLDPATPTLILAEVVLPYMEVERSDALIQWAAGHFLRACFILYEQIHPSDPFGHIMQSHFSRLQSPLRSLISYPDCKAQQMRFLQRGWTECHIVDMNEFYRSFVPVVEQKRIQALEPFDEFEVGLLWCVQNEWHLKCSHYFILAASKGEASFAPPVFSRMEASPAHCAPCFAGTVAASFCVAGGAVTGLKRYGHCSVLFTPDIILTTGGFGDHGGRHCRLTELHILVKHQGDWKSGKVRLAELEMAWDGRLFHTVNVLRSGWAVVLGGRKSPESPALPPLRLKGLAGADPLNLVIELAPLLPVEGLAGLSVPRWRHTATVVTQEDPRCVGHLGRRKEGWREGTLTFCSLSRAGLPLRLRRLQFWAVGADRLAFSAFGGAPLSAGAGGLRPLRAHSGACPPFKCCKSPLGRLFFGCGGQKESPGRWVPLNSQKTQGSLNALMKDPPFQHMFTFTEGKEGHTPTVPCSDLGPCSSDQIQWEPHQSLVLSEWQRVPSQLNLVGEVGGGEVGDLEKLELAQHQRTNTPSLLCLLPRYSHTAHVHRGKLLLVGGVWLSPPLVPGVAVIDLETRALAEYRIDTVS
ncbi:Leucine carboxyl methyltransferase 2, partial [Ophiophagus hannah]